MIPADQLKNRLRDANFGFKKQGKRVDIWKKKGSTDRVTIPRRDFMTLGETKSILRQAGLPESDIQQFFLDCTQADPPKD